jgi:hypothetical protein
MIVSALWIERKATYDGTSRDIDGNEYTTRVFNVDTENRLLLMKSPQIFQHPITGVFLPGVGSSIITQAGSPPQRLYAYNVRCVTVGHTTDLVVEYTNNPQLLSLIVSAEGDDALTSIARVQSDQAQLVFEDIPVGIKVSMPSLQPGTPNTTVWVQSSIEGTRQIGTLIKEAMIPTDKLPDARIASKNQSGHLHIIDGLLARYFSHDSQTVSSSLTRMRYVWEIDYGIKALTTPLANFADGPETYYPAQYNYGPNLLYGTAYPTGPMICPPYYRLRYTPRKTNGIFNYSIPPGIYIVPTSFAWSSTAGGGPGLGWKTLSGLT